MNKPKLIAELVSDNQAGTWILRVEGLRDRGGLADRDATPIGLLVEKIRGFDILLTDGDFDSFSCTRGSRHSALMDAANHFGWEY